MTWIPEDEWTRIQQVLPIVVVDILLLTEENPPRVGLIQRETPHQGIRWNLLGGRIRYGESIAEALDREVAENLGAGLKIELGDAARPHFVAQYGPFKKSGFSLDPRKHAIGLTYVMRASGTANAKGSEALAFQWFSLYELPIRDSWGFEQDQAAEACLRNAGFAPRFRTEM